MTQNWTLNLLGMNECCNKSLHHEGFASHINFAPHIPFAPTQLTDIRHQATNDDIGRCLSLFIVCNNHMQKRCATTTQDNDTTMQTVNEQGTSREWGHDNGGTQRRVDNGDTRRERHNEQQPRHGDKVQHHIPPSDPSPPPPSDPSPLPPSLHPSIPSLHPSIPSGDGVCNGSHGILTCATPQVLEVQLLSGEHAGELIFIPRMGIIPNEMQVPFKLKHRQFPVRLCFAMTINKSHGQSVNHVGISVFKSS